MIARAKTSRRRALTHGAHRRHPVVAFRTRRRALSPAQLIVLSFAAVIVAGTLMLRLPVAHAPGADIGWLQAVFRATSAVCVTGLVVVDTGRDFSPVGQAVILLLIQMGGLGILRSRRT